MTDTYGYSTAGEPLTSRAPSAAPAPPPATPEPVSAKPPSSPQEIAEQYEVVARAKGAEAAKKQELTAATREQMRGIQQQYEPQIAEAGKVTEFKPSQETAGELAALFGMIGAMGALGGKGSYASALGAMNAMGGMLKGYNQGRKDVFEREKAIYDKKVQENKLHFDRITQAYERAQKAAPYNLSEAQTKLEQELTALGANVLAQQAKQEGMSKSYEMWRLARNNYDMNQSRLSRNLKPPADKSSLQQVIGPDGKTPAIWDVNKNDYVRDANGQILTPVPKGSSVKEREPGEITKRVVSNVIPTIQNTEKLIEQLNNPEFAAKLDKYRAEVFMREEGGKVVSQFLSKKIPDDVKKFIISLTKLRNDYYLEISGKAVTNNEAMRNYNAVPQPGDTADDYKVKLGVLLGDHQTRYDTLKQQYPEYMKRFPPTSAAAAAPTTTQALPAGIPAGSVLIGSTPDGKTPVYQAPDGKKYTPEGQ